ncbi:MAG: GAF and ANTAR domain-containing protein [Acidimicrobiia bacterium]
MPQVQDLLAAFVEFADTFVDDYDVVEFLHRLAERCVELVTVSEAGIMLADRDGRLRYVASSSERMHLIELFELQQNQGPCLDAYRRGVAVHSGMKEEANTRWPRFVPHARDVGFQSVSALPMRLRAQVIGALNLFSTTPELLSPVDQQVAQALADIATIGILQERALSDGHVVTSQLEAALESRVLIEQAKGIVAEHHHVSVDDAFQLLRGYARKHNRLLRQTANDIIDGTLDPDALAEPTLSRRT